MPAQVGGKIREVGSRKKGKIGKDLEEEGK